MQIKVLEMTAHDLQKHANSIKEDLINRLAADGLLSNPEDVNLKYVYVLSSKGTLGKVFDKLFGLESEDRWSLRLLKLDNK
jgi:hypothetical protein